MFYFLCAVLLCINSYSEAEAQIKLKPSNCTVLKKQTDDGKSYASVETGVTKWAKTSHGFVDVPYTFLPGLTTNAMNAIETAIEQFSWFTCVNVRPKEDSDVDYLAFKDSTVCASYIGKQGGAQEVDVASNCGVRETVHEILHALGFDHEHTRPDRDEFVQIFTSNIQRGKEHNFDLNSNVDSMGTQYDLQSIMHYDSYAFAINEDIPTILQNNGSEIPIEMIGFSSIDIEQLNLYYDCKGVNQALGDNPSTCYYQEDSGLSYRGTVGVSVHGNPCSHWSDIFINYEKYRFHLADLRENYCRSFYQAGYSMPVCYDAYVGGFAVCDIPVCDTSTTTTTPTTTMTTPTTTTTTPTTTTITTTPTTKTTTHTTTTTTPSSTETPLDALKWYKMLAKAFDHFISHVPVPGNLYPVCNKANAPQK